MFKKLKDKIAEEVKSSPQRIVELAQSVQNSYGAYNDTSSQKMNSNFSIAEEDTPENSPNKSGFTNVNLDMSANSSTRTRKGSTSSIASDISSFLPSYESPGNLYHLQSDIDASASELDDSSLLHSQYDTVSKENLYKAYNMMRTKYNKYRGRYTDLARHYRELERENGRVKAVLVETQDKTLRRVAELKEQCSLEQSAKAHLEQALRVDLDEKQLTIDALKQKIGLLQKTYGQPLDVSTELINFSKDSDLNNLIDSESILKDLNEARTEIENLHKQLYEERNNNTQQTLEIKNKNLMITEQQSLLNDRNIEIDVLNDKVKTLDELLEENKTLKHELDKNNDRIQMLIEDSKEIITIKDKLSEVIKENSVLNTKLNDTAEKLKQSENKINQLNQDFEEIHKKNIENINRVQSLTEEVSNLNNRNSELSENLKKKDILIEDYKNTFTEKENEILILKQENNNVQKCLEEAKIALSESACLNSKMSESIKILENDIQEKMIINSNSDIDLTELEIKYESLVRENDNLKSIIYNNNREKEDMILSLATIEVERNDFEASLKVALDTIEDIQKERKEYLNQISELNNINAHFKTQISTYKKNCQEYVESIKNLKRYTDDLNEKNNLLSKNNESGISNDENYERVQLNQVIDDINSSIQMIATEKQNYLQQIMFLQTENEELNEKLNEQIKNNESLQNQIKNEEKKLQELKKECLEYKNLHEELLQKINTLETQVDDLSNEIADLNKEKEEKSTEIREHMEKCLKLQSDLNHLTESYEKLDSENEVLLNKQKHVHSDMLVKENELKAKQMCLKEYESNIADMKANLELKDNQIQELILTLEDRKVEIDNVSSELLALQTERSQLKELLSQLSNVKNNNDLKQSEIEKLNIENSKLCSDISCFASEKLHLIAQLNELETENENLKVEKISIVEEVERLKNCKKDVADLETCMGNKDTEINALNEKIKVIEDLVERKKKFTTDLSSKIEDLDNQLHEKNCKISALMQKVEQLENKEYETKHLLEKIDEMESLDVERLQELQSLNEKLNIAFEDIESKSTENSELRKKLKVTEDEIDTLKNSDSVDDEINQLKTKLKNQNEELRVFIEKINQLETKDKTNAEEIDVLNQNIVELNTVNNSSKSNLDFYEKELEKLRNKNDKLTEKLDETLVILKHTSEMQFDTEMEYLRNVLYNYMTGKESVVLAKVIAAVCKFSQEQTNTVLQREIQKQTLFGQLGFI